MKRTNYQRAALQYVHQRLSPTSNRCDLFERCRFHPQERQQRRNFPTKRQQRHGMSPDEEPVSRTAVLHPSKHTKLQNLRLDSKFLANDDTSSLFGLQQASELFDPQIHLPSAPHPEDPAFEPLTPLGREIMALIGVTGRPITVAHFMQLALTHPEYGYYTQAVGSNRKHTGRREDSAKGGDQGADAVSVKQDDFDVDDWDDDDQKTSESDSKDSNGSSSEDDRIVIGADFVTAPEVSQVFGECLGVWFFTQWQKQGSPSLWQWLECGPGKGTLSVDILRFVAKLSDPTLLKSLQEIHLVETSPVLRKVQKKALLQLARELKSVITFQFDDDDSVAPTTNKASPIRVQWHDSFTAFRLSRVDGDLKEKDIPTFAVCQEFFDALPIHAFQKSEEGYWRERLIDAAIRPDALEDKDKVDHDLNEVNAPRFRVVLAPEATPALQTLLPVDKEGYWESPTEAGGTVSTDPRLAKEGNVIEICPESIMLVKDMASMIASTGGAVLIIDYGLEGSTDSIRGFTSHEQVAFLRRPGEIDITADVDFAALKHVVNSGSDTTSRSTAASGSTAFGPTGQGEFLVAMGLQERVVQLIELPSTTEEQAENLYESMVRLASAEEMGERYKVMCVVPTTSDVPPAFSRTT